MAKLDKENRKLNKDDSWCLCDDYLAIEDGQSRLTL